MHPSGAVKLLARGLCASVLTLILPDTGIAASADHDFSVLRDQVYAQRSSGALTGDLYRPATPVPAPGVIMIHGGGWSGGERKDMERFARRVAASGFAVFNISYRLAPEHRFPAQLEDVREAVRWLRSRATGFGIDPQRIGAWGYSAGAHLAMLLGTTDDKAPTGSASASPDFRVAAVVAGAGPTDLRRYPDNKYVADLMPPDAGDALYALASPIAAVSSDDAPMFLYHGRHDWIVGYSNSTNMLAALHGVGVTARLYELPFGHIFGYLFGGRAVEAGIEFLRMQFGAAPG